ncbi:MAG: hypothetical protein KDK25_04500, partial [Leptospiraceae bacterium]|nr:hypothetical protein [Leptospiraceae bacterium]
MASSPRTRQSLSGTEADSLLCGIPVRTATAILSLLLLAGCGPYRHGFKIADPATQCKDCYHSLYFLSPESDPGPALELA